jgi:hypothetical protein
VIKPLRAEKRAFFWLQKQMHKLMFSVAEVSYSGCSIDLTNEPPEHWFYKRNKLRPESLKLDLHIPSNGNWLVKAARV